MSNFSEYTEVYQGLSTQNAKENLKLYGFNNNSKLEEDGKVFKKTGVFLSLRFVLMLISSVILYISGNILFGTVSIALIIIYSITEIYKGEKCDEILHKLRRSSATRFKVIRDSEIILLLKERMVPDDIIVLEAGESVPADAHLLDAVNLTCDESLFTGDNSPVVKFVGSDSKNEIKQTCIYKGTRILSGYLAARVIATGMDTKDYKYFGENYNDDFYYTEFESAINRIMPVISIISFILLIFVGFFSFFENTGSDVRKIIAEAFLPALAFALCFVPAEAASCVRLFYAMTALKMAKSGCIIKDLSSIEKLSSITTFLIDKTGIVTKNNIEVAEEFSKNPEMLSNIAILSCDIETTSSVDKAIILNASLKHINYRELQQNELIKCFPYSDESMLGGNLWIVNNSKLLCIKGSPDNIFTICNLNHEQLYAVQNKKQQYSKQGRQVIAVAYAMLKNDQPVPNNIRDLEYNFVGFLAFTNQTKDSIPDALRGCYRSGVKVIMTTGDSSESARAIGEKIGLRNIAVMTGDVLKKTIEDGNISEIKDINIFARVNPKQKADILKILKDNNEIVGISGNESDVDLLLGADIGITRSQYVSGTAQEASGLLISDDDFGTVIEMVKESRQTHRNIKSALSISLSSTIVFILFFTLNILMGKTDILPCFLVSLFGVIITPVVMMFFINNTVDLKGVFSPSRYIGYGKINKSFFTKSISQGLSLFIFSVILYILMPEAGESVNRTSFALTYTSGLITMGWVNLSHSIPVYKLIFRKENFTVMTSGIVLLFLMMLIYIPYINYLFDFTALNPLLFTLSLLLGIISQIGFEFMKNKKGIS